MTVVSDSSPLIALARIHRLEVIEAQFGRIARARRIAQRAGLNVTGCAGLLEAAVRKGIVEDLREVYVELLRQGVRFEIRLLQDSLERMGYRPL